MSTLSTRLPPGPTPEPVFRLTVEQYHAMIQAGILTDDDPVELLEGILVFKMPKNPLHSACVLRLGSRFASLLPSGWHVRTQEPVTLDDGEPEPDAAVARGGLDDYSQRHPGPLDVAIVIEVSDSTLQRDRGIKLRSYARAGIATYWIVDVTARVVDVYSVPDVAAPQPDYRQRQSFQAPAAIPVELDGRQIGVIPVSDILG